jgi:hypothetical protein
MGLSGLGFLATATGMHGDGIGSAWLHRLAGTEVVLAATV